MIGKRAYVICAAACVAAHPIWANDFQISFPLECDLSTECYVQQYVDHDPSPKASDFSCSFLTYDGHKGTDFGLRDPALLDRGVFVVAAAAGRVVARRDGVIDKIYTAEDAERVDKIECGNGVVIQHDDGWQTQYCHMKQGSVTVTKGQIVAQGDPLGQVGVSGKAAFPHLHLSVRQGNRVVDPYAPNGQLSCDGDLETLWDLTPAYQQGDLLYIGFSDRVPEFDDVKMGTVPQELTPQSPALVMYVHGFGTQKGDQLELEFTGPAGTIAQQTITLPKDQAQMMRAIGRNRKADWPRGSYTATARLIRNGVEIQRLQNDMRID